MPETIEVTKDGTTTTVGWTYNPSTNSIDFDADYVPEGGTTVDVTYALYGECDE